MKIALNHQRHMEAACGQKSNRLKMRVRGEQQDIVLENSSRVLATPHH
jgi:hypothetical protein